MHLDFVHCEKLKLFFFFFQFGAETQQSKVAPSSAATRPIQSSREQVQRSEPGVIFSMHNSTKYLWHILMAYFKHLWMVKLLKQIHICTLFCAFIQGGKSEIFVDVIERLSVVLGSNVSDPDTEPWTVCAWTVSALWSSSPAAQMLQGVLMKADVEGEVRVKCYMPSCSGESWQLTQHFFIDPINFKGFIYLNWFGK